MLQCAADVQSPKSQINRYVAECCIELQRAAVCSSMLQCVAACCRVLQRVADAHSHRRAQSTDMLQCDAESCSVPQCVEVY